MSELPDEYTCSYDPYNGEWIVYDPCGDECGVYNLKEDAMDACHELNEGDPMDDTWIERAYESDIPWKRGNSA